MSLANEIRRRGSEKSKAEAEKASNTRSIMASFSPFSAAAAAMQEFQLWERGGVAAAAQSRNLYIAKKSVGYRPPPGSWATSIRN